MRLTTEPSFRVGELSPNAGLPICMPHAERHPGGDLLPLPWRSLMSDDSSERLSLAAALRAIIDASNLHELKAHTRRALSLFLPCEHFVFTRGRVKADRVTVSHLAYTDAISDDAWNEIAGQRDRETTPLGLELIRHCGQPKFMTIDRLEKSASPHRVSALRKHGIENIAWVVLPGMHRNTFTGYFFQNVSGAVRADIKLRLMMLAPYLHIAMNRLADTQHRDAAPIADHKPSPRAASLSRREREVARWIARGKTNWEIGQILGISEKTAKTHVQNILSKLGATSRAQVAALISGEASLVCETPRTRTAVVRPSHGGLSAV